MKYSVFLGNGIDQQEGRLLGEFKEKEIIAGMLAAGIGIVFDMNKRLKQKYYIDSDADVSEYRIARNVDPSDFSFYMCQVKTKLLPNEYGIWLRGEKDNTYNLYRAKSELFFQGISTICQAFKIEPRNYIYGVPFDNQDEKYSLNGFSLTEYSRVPLVSDEDDIDVEEVDDENVIQPLELE